MCRRVGPVQQHAAQAGDDAGDAQLLVQHVVEDIVLPTQPVMAPEGLNSQQVHGEDLADNALVGGTHPQADFRLPQHGGVFQQA
ncbi:hypothetical protein D3C76_1669100 [compost metagenome]